MTAALLAAGVAQAASTVYISNCCDYPSPVEVFQTSNGAQTNQFLAGTGAWDAVFTVSGTYAYVTNNISQSVSVIQVLTGTVVATIPIGFDVEWLAITPDGTQVFMGSFDGADVGHLVAIDTATNTVTQTRTFPAPLLSPMAISPDSTKLYLCLSTGEGTNSLSVLDTKSLTVEATVPLYVAVSVALTPDGKFAYVANFGSSSKYSPNVAVVNTATNSVVTTIPLNPRLDPSYLAVSPDGSVVYVGEFQLYANARPVMAVISTSNNKLVDVIPLANLAEPGKVVFSPDSTTAYVTDYENSAIDVFNVSKRQLTSVLPVLGSSHGLAISPDGATLFAPSFGSSRAAAVDLSSGSIGASIPVGDMGSDPSFPEFGGAAVSPDGTRAYITSYASNNVTVLNTSSNAVVASVPVGAEPVGIVLTPGGSTAYVADQNQNSVTAIDTSTLATTLISLPASGYPTAIAITPDGSHVWVTSYNFPPDSGFSLSYVFVIDTSTNTVVHTSIVPYALGVAISPDGTKAYVVSATGTPTLLTISTASYKVTGSVSLTGGFAAGEATTAGIAVTPDGTRVVADDGSDGTVWEINAASNTIVATIKVGSIPGNLAITPDGSEIWAADYLAPAVSVIDVASATVARTVPLGNPSFGVAIAP